MGICPIKYDNWQFDYIKLWENKITFISIMFKQGNCSFCRWFYVVFSNILKNLDAQIEISQLRKENSSKMKLTLKAQTQAI